MLVPQIQAGTGQCSSSSPPGCVSCPHTVDGKQPEVPSLLNPGHIAWRPHSLGFQPTPGPNSKCDLGQVTSPFPNELQSDIWEFDSLPTGAEALWGLG